MSMVVTRRVTKRPRAFMGGNLHHLPAPEPDRCHEAPQRTHTHSWAALPTSLTGGPAAGKSATARRLVEPLRRAAVIDVDDIRHLVVAGHAAPWDGAEGQLQQRIGVENACALAPPLSSLGHRRRPVRRPNLRAR